MIASQLKTLGKHFISAVIFTAVLLVFAYFLFSKTADFHQKQAQAFIAQVMEGTSDSLSLESKSTLLIDSGLFSFINITNSQNILIDTYIDKNAFNLPFQSPPCIFYIDNTKIEYRYNNTHTSYLFIQFIAAVFFCSWIAFILSSAIHKVRLSSLKSNFNKYKQGHLKNTNQSNDISYGKPSSFDAMPSDALNQPPADIDTLTHLKNRNAFVEYFTQSIDTQSTEKFHMIAITRCSELKTINQIQGFHEGDNYVIHVANIMKAAIENIENGQLFRLNSSDFACLVPDISKVDAESFAMSLTKDFNLYQSSSEIDSVAYTGIVLFSEPTPLGELLALSDTGISIAQTKSINACHFHQDSEGGVSLTLDHRNWRQEIDNVLENQRINLLLQPIKPNGKNTKIYHEVLARFLNSKNELLPTASFISMAEKLDKIVALDRMIIEKAITDISQYQLQQQIFGINVSSRTINDEYFVIWLERRLLREPETAKCLVFEITESGLQHNIKASKRFIDTIHRTGARVTVERFGVDLTSFKFFKELNPDFIKMDSTYTRDIDEDKNNQYFLRLMIDLAHRLNIKVLAESVENKKELMMLNQLFIDGCQGFYLGKPQPMINIENKET